jgi:hypothetical protein
LPERNNIITKQNVNASKFFTLARKSVAKATTASKLLRYIVQETLKGKGLKESKIALSLFGRERDYDPAVDTDRP